MDTNQAWGNIPFNPHPPVQGAPWAWQTPQVPENVLAKNQPPVRNGNAAGTIPGMKPGQKQSVPQQPAQKPAAAGAMHPGSGLSRTEKLESARVTMETRLSQYGFAGFQVVRREFISHSFEPCMTVKENSITFNNSCITRLENANYIQFLINPEEQKLIIRPCGEGDRDAIRWCVTKADKRRSRQITCRDFTGRLYELMGWDREYRYKLQGIGIQYRGEKMYLFDLQSKEAYAPAVRNPITGRRSYPKAVLPEDWKESFGMPVDEHELSTQVDLEAGYMDPGGMESEQEPAQAVTDTETSADPGEVSVSE